MKERILFAYVGGSKFHVRFFKEDPELARVNKELKKKIEELWGIIVREYQVTNGKRGNAKTCSLQVRNEDL